MRDGPSSPAAPPSDHPEVFSRRGFLRLAGASAGAALLAGCRPAVPTTAAAGQGRVKVAIAQARTYDYALVRRQAEDLLDLIGGVQDIVRPGAKAVIKVNLTGGVYGGPPPAGTTAPESYVTHPTVARAFAELLRDAGAGEIVIADSVWEPASYDQWGYTEMARAAGATLLDLNRPDPYPDFAEVPVGAGWFVYERLTMNRALAEADVFVSLAKLKCHYLCGITQSMKNLVGLAPFAFYERTKGDGYRTAFHGAESETKTRLPRVVVDLNRARPIHLALIDGIRTVEGSEGPWNNDLAAVSPGILIGGKDPVASDSIAVAAMGFDPTADYPAAPFLRAENHLILAARAELGTNRLGEIEVAGVALGDVRTFFRPAW